MSTYQTVMIIVACMASFVIPFLLWLLKIQRDVQKLKIEAEHRDNDMNEMKELIRDTNEKVNKISSQMGETIAVLKATGVLNGKAAALPRV